MRGAPRGHVEFCGEVHPIVPGRPLVVGRDADVALDEDNDYLHRRFLEVLDDGAWCWLTNIGTRLAATVHDPDGFVHAQLAPGARLPMLLPVTLVLFTAGRASYELAVHVEQPAYAVRPPVTPGAGETTVGGVELTTTQRLLLVALAEPSLRRRGTGTSSVPSSAQAAARLGWPLTTFNRKLDNVCDKLSRAGVAGLHGAGRGIASHRKARLVEHALATRLVVAADLALLPVAGSAGAP